MHKNSLQPNRYYRDNPRFCSQQTKSRCTFLANHVFHMVTRGWLKCHGGGAFSVKVLKSSESASVSPEQFGKP